MLFQLEVSENIPKNEENEFFFFLDFSKSWWIEGLDRKAELQRTLAFETDDWGLVCGSLTPYFQVLCPLQSKNPLIKNISNLMTASRGGCNSVR